jgi:hypothetical protein
MTEIKTDNWVVSNVEVNEIKPEYTVKINNGIERFWVLVKSITDDGTIIGTVNNNLIHNRSYNFGNTIKFKRENVYVVHTTEYLIDNSNKLENKLFPIIQSLLDRGVPLDKIPIELDRMFTK